MARFSYFFWLMCVFSFLVFLGFTLLLLLLFFWALYICLCSSLCSFLVQFRGMSSRMQLFLLLWFLFGSFWCIALVLAVQNSKLFSESYYFEPYLHQNQLAFKWQFVRKAGNHPRSSFEFLRYFFRLWFSIVYLVYVHISMKFQKIFP